MCVERLVLIESFYSGSQLVQGRIYLGLLHQMFWIDVLSI